MLRLSIAAVLMALALPCFGQAAPLPKPAPDPATQPFVPPGEKPFYGDTWNVIPGTRIWVQWLGDRKI